MWYNNKKNIYIRIMREEYKLNFCKKLCSLFLATLMVFSIAACAGTSQTGAAPEEVIQTAKTNMQAVTNLESEKVVDMSMSMGEETLNLKTSANITTFTDPMKLKIAMTMDMGEEFGGPQTSEIYADETDGNINIYMNIMDAWYKQAVSTEQLITYDTKQSVATYLDTVTDLKQTATEQINGANATKYDGVITGAKMKEAVEATGALESLQSMLAGLNMDAQTLYDGLSDISISIWIDEQGYPVKCEMDMTKMGQDLMTKLMQASGNTAGEGITIGNMTLSFVNKNFNQAAEFEIPEEAKNASEINMQQ